MISGEITTENGGGYRVVLANGQSFRLESDHVPAALRGSDKKINVMFGGVDEAGVDPAEARAVINNLLGAS